MTFPDFSTIISRESIDLTMLVFLWLVQVIIYPSFKEISKESILHWHKAYQFKISIIMGPVMLFQFYVITFDVINSVSQVSIIRFLLLIASWLLTIMVSVPLHRKIERNEDLENSINKLIQTNVPRTLTWTGIYLTHFL